MPVGKEIKVCQKTITMKEVIFEKFEERASQEDENHHGWSNGKKEDIVSITNEKFNP